VATRQRKAEQKSKVLMLLEAAGSQGVKANDVAEAARIPKGTASSWIHKLYSVKAINRLPDARYCLPKFGGEAYEPLRRGSGHKPNGTTPPPKPHVEIAKPEDVHKLKTVDHTPRLVVTVGGDRKSMTIYEAKLLHKALSELFGEVKTRMRRRK